MGGVDFVFGLALGLGYVKVGSERLKGEGWRLDRGWKVKVGSQMKCEM